MPDDTELSISREDIESLRGAGFAVVPIVPTEKMKNAGLIYCYEEYDGTNDWNRAYLLAEECYQEMVICGCL